MNPSLYFNILFFAFNTLQTAVVSAVSVRQKKKQRATTNYVSREFKQ